jgi:hypothetical protein
MGSGYDDVMICLLIALRWCWGLREGHIVQEDRAKLDGIFIL